MEAYAVMRAVSESGRKNLRGLVIKGVQDFAREDRDDQYRDYAAYVSAAFLREFLSRYHTQLGL
jgi:hypothetical protein